MDDEDNFIPVKKKFWITFINILYIHGQKMYLISFKTQIKHGT